MNTFVYILWFGLAALGGNVHDFHLSKTDIHFKSDQQAIQFTVHMFIDDFEKAIETRDSVLLKLFTEKESPQSDSLSAEYLTDKLKIRIDGEIYYPEFLGMELSDDMAAIWCYMELLNISNLDELSISNKLLLELFGDQKNIVNIKVDNKVKEFVIMDQKTFKKAVRL
ncbi:MAG: hypothetical protein HKN09_02440 [Saprospiraceae bacterium]|nr:hypothetical protein [Saprospiraceae bacterium]